MLDHHDLAPVLQAIGVAEAAEEVLDVGALATELDAELAELSGRLEAVRAWGLALPGEYGLPPLLLRAGRQYLARHGAVTPAVLDFLPGTVDDLDARAALLQAGTNLIDAFRAAILDGRAVEHATTLVPRAFAPAVDEPLALDLFAAAVALLARLAGGEPAGCVAEEVLAVALVEEAEAVLDARLAAGELEEPEADAATSEVRGLFDLLQETDVLDLFDMGEPADAAVASATTTDTVVDQRLEAWFAPFPWAAQTGHLRPHPTDAT
ncbi:hypothetical protein [Conexibacter sp. SYSU D00693]|uniref:hypothetical protein n=1 Tax=Conexibacter sp. SYSU D00693 TaxID=2812560 RepID=UPI00196A66B8|nr:hypothetical protein [Conexibacter sp. SYSU D00693]